MLKRFLPLAFVAFYACVRVPFTETLHDTITAKDSTAVQSLQFYTDRQITLERTSDSRITAINGGKISYNNGTYKEYVYIKKSTKVVCKPAPDGQLSAYVGLGDNEYLPFRIINGVYSLNISLYKSGKRVNYAGQKYLVTTGWDAQLQVSKKGTTTKEKKIKFARGVKLGEK
jgi:hypothetical protein